MAKHIRPFNENNGSMTPEEKALEIFNFFYTNPRTIAREARKSSIKVIDEVVGALRYSGVSTDFWDEVREYALHEHGR